jgi:Flp pilus assembly protein TadG
MVIRQNATAMRTGATAVEMAIVLPVLFLLTFGLVIGGIGIFRYQAVASLAREAARYASVHGTNYQLDTGAGAVSKANIYTAAIVPQASGLDLSQLTYTINYNAPSAVDWDSATHAPQYVSSTSGGTPKTATVSVTINYNWAAPLYFGTITLTSTSVMPMSY